jgi:hypothetical protein
VSDSPSSAPASPSEPPAASPEPEWLKLDPAKLQESIAELRANNQDFLRLFNTEVGSVAARKYKPEIDARERQIEDLRKQLRKTEIQAMPERDIEAQIASDPDFAKEWAELIHYKPTAYEEDPTPQILEAYEDAVQTALSRGVTQAFIDQVTEKAAQGGYRNDDVESWQTTFRRFEKDLTNEALRVTKSGSPSSPAVNNALLKGGPDGSGSRRGDDSGFRAEFKSVREFKNLPASRRAEVVADTAGKKYVEELMAKG